jgi:anion-transporting  ArsA/GET3 family ATPase
MITYAFCGKGGVGKSTLSVEMARRLMKKGRTALMAIDQQHNIENIIEHEGYIIDTVLVDHNNIEYVTKIVEQVVETTILHNFKEYLPVLAPDFITIAGLAKTFSAIKGIEYTVIDFPPNHAALTMLLLPAIMEKWAFKAFTIRHRVKKLITGSDLTMKNLEYTRDLLGEFREVIRKTRFCCVGTPTYLGFIETVKLVEYLRQEGLNPYRIIVNMFERSEDSSCKTCRKNADRSNIMVQKYITYAMDESIPIAIITRTDNNNRIMEELKFAE